MTGTSVTIAGSNALIGAAEKQFVTMRLGEQLFGLSVLNVQDVIRYQDIAPIPLAPPVIAGSLNVRGRIVTAIDMRARLGMAPYPSRDTIMMVVVEHQHELFALMVDAVGDVLPLSANRAEKTPGNINPAWRSLSSGVFKLEQELLVIIEVASIIDHLAKGTAA